jgi:tRNA-splicing ligase RtcB (3'-phosphate/5'-hydroxy nucleic acid ligase)
VWARVAQPRASRTQPASPPLVPDGPNRYRIPRSWRSDMRTDGLIFASPGMLEAISADRAALQVANVATLPGIVGQSLAMPDIHWGYGFPIGGVAAMDEHEGVVSPGGVGYDINCGVRLIRTNLSEREVKPKIKALVDALFASVPAGVGGKGRLSGRGAMDEVLAGGASWAIEQGYGWSKDPQTLEEGGRMQAALPEHVSEKARKRGQDQVGSLGAGNHFLEVQAIDRIEDEASAKATGLQDEGQVAIMLHTGSRGLGHQVCSDHLEALDAAQARWRFELVDRQLACAPLTSHEAHAYIGAMFAAANYAWANRQVITHHTRLAFERVFQQSAEDMDMHVVYDVSHNMAKWEEHQVEGRRKRLLIHRKGATRAFGPGHPDVPARYRELGQPVLVPGDMAHGSWMLMGTQGSMQQSWGSSCHGAGRRLSRAAANKSFQHEAVLKDLAARGVSIRSHTREGVTEEAPGAYKDVDDVVGVVHDVGIAKKAVRLRPLAVVKG